jgi:uncharacterized protein (DUF1697 family)
MAKYIAFLRGINVSGQKLIKMEELRKLFESMKLKNVASYIQSGNVVFEAPGEPKALLKKIKNGIHKTFGFDVETVLRTDKEIAAVVKNDPFKKSKGIDYKKVYVAFLSEEPSREAKAEFDYKGDDVEALHLKGKELYILYTEGMGKAKFTHNYIERKLKITATARNWNTVNKMLEMVS